MPYSRDNSNKIYRLRFKLLFMTSAFKQCIILEIIVMSEITGFHQSVSVYMCQKKIRRCILDHLQCFEKILVALAGGMVSSSIGIGVALSSSLIPQVIEEGLATDFRTGSWIGKSILNHSLFT